MGKIGKRIEKSGQWLFFVGRFGTALRRRSGGGGLDAGAAFRKGCPAGMEAVASAGRTDCFGCGRPNGFGIFL